MKEIWLIRKELSLVLFLLSFLVLSSCRSHHQHGNPLPQIDIVPMGTIYKDADVICFGETHYIAESLGYLVKELPDLVKEYGLDNFMTESIPATLNGILENYLNDVNAEHLEIEQNYIQQIKKGTGWATHPYFVPMLRTLWKIKRDFGDSFHVCGIDALPSNGLNREAALTENAIQCMTSSRKSLIHAGMGHCKFANHSESFQPLIIQLDAKIPNKYYVSVLSGLINKERMPNENVLTILHNLYFDLTNETYPSSPTLISSQNILSQYSPIIDRVAGRKDLVSRVDYILVAPFVSFPTWDYAISLYNQIKNN
jgi:hypothetical protein